MNSSFKDQFTYQDSILLSIDSNLTIDSSNFENNSVNEGIIIFECPTFDKLVCESTISNNLFENNTSIQPNSIIKYTEFIPSFKNNSISEDLIKGFGYEVELVEGPTILASG